MPTKSTATMRWCCASLACTIATIAAYYGNPIGFYGSLPKRCPFKPLANDWATWCSMMCCTAPGKVRWCRKWASSPAAAKARCEPPNWAATYSSPAKHRTNLARSPRERLPLPSPGHHATESIAIHRLGEFIAGGWHTAFGDQIAIWFKPALNAYQ